MADLFSEKWVPGGRAKINAFEPGAERRRRVRGNGRWMRRSSSSFGSAMGAGVSYHEFAKDATAKRAGDWARGSPARSCLQLRERAQNQRPLVEVEESRVGPLAQDALP